LSQAQHVVADAIRVEAKRMGALVNNLLDMARIQSGEVRLHLEWHPIEEVVGTALRAAAGILGGRKVGVDIPADLPLVQMDAVLIERVLANLLENAAKYAGADARIAIDARVAGGALEVGVEDDGPGIPSGQEEAIFEKFARGQAESATPGVGLGLAICRAIVEAHQGRIRAEPGRARGARFVFTLPAGEPPEVRSP
jgi:two-component system sensor histidine kinase KdpD